MCKLDPANDKRDFSKLSKDDSVIREERETQEYLYEGKDLVDSATETVATIEQVKAPAGKRFIRSVSMPAKDMRSRVKLIEEKERKSKIGVDFFIENVPEEDGNMKFVETEKEVNLAKIPDSEKTLIKDVTDGNEPDAKPYKILHPKNKKTLHLDSIKEDIQEEENNEDADNEVETSGKQEY